MKTWLIVAMLWVPWWGVGAAFAEPECPLSEACVFDGECSLVQGKCVRASDADCMQSGQCQFGGECVYSASAAHRCVAKAPCAKTPACKAYGACQDSDYGQCYHSDEGCEASDWCKFEGRCRTSSGPSLGCVPEYTCADLPVCTERGACEVVSTGDDTRCEATTTDACMKSRQCARFGLCQKDPQGSGCRATESACGRSLECKAQGLCGLVAGLCVATEKGCAESEACKKFGTCKVVGIVCASVSGDVCEGVEVTGLTAKATSEHKPFPPYAFEAKHLVDRDLRTSWQPASKKGGVGEVLTLSWTGPRKMSRLEIGNGFQRRDMLGDLFEMNSRAARVVIRVGGATVAATLDDVMGLQAVNLPPIEADKVEIEIMTVEKGSRWKDLAISEVRVFACR